jgi:hypothetical protein
VDFFRAESTLASCREKSKALFSGLQRQACIAADEAMSRPGSIAAATQCARF